MTVPCCAFLIFSLSVEISTDSRDLLRIQVYVHPCDESPPASKYILRQTTKAAHRTGPLSSSFAATPRVMRAVLRRPPPRRPAKGLLEKAAWRDYLGVIPNPGYEPNSLLFGKGKAAYEVGHVVCRGLWRWRPRCPRLEQES